MTACHGGIPKKMFKVKGEDPTIGQSREESKIVELDDDEPEP